MKYTHSVFRDALWTCLWASVRVSIYLELSLNWITQPAQGESQQTSNVLMNSFSRNLDQSSLPADNCQHYKHIYNNDTVGISLCSFVAPPHYLRQSSSSILPSPVGRTCCGGVCLWHDQRPLRQRGLSERSRRNVRGEIWEVSEEIKPRDLC